MAAETDSEVMGAFAMNVGIGDCDNNGFFDIYVTNIGESAHLMNTDGQFSNEAEERGTTFDRTGWGGSFFDYDNDADLDLYVNAFADSYELPNALYDNDGNGFFTEPLFETGGLGGSDTLKW